jgi:hypothetical protein
MPPTRAILFRDSTYNKRLSKKIRMKNEQGLKLSIAPSRMVRMGNEYSQTLMTPNGVVLLHSSVSSVVSPYREVLIAVRRLWRVILPDSNVMLVLTTTAGVVVNP